VEPCRHLTISQWQSLCKEAAWVEDISTPLLCLADDYHDDDISGYALDPTKEEWGRLETLPHFVEMRTSRHRRFSTQRRFRRPGTPRTTHRVVLYPEQPPALIHLLPEDVVVDLQPGEGAIAFESDLAPLFVFGVLSSCWFTTWLNAWATAYDPFWTSSNPVVYKTQAVEHALRSFSPPPLTDEITSAAHKLSEARSNVRGLLMTGPLGLDRAYFHSPACHMPWVMQLRLLQHDLDWAVTRAYGWAGMALYHNFCEKSSTFGVEHECRKEILSVLEAFAAKAGHPLFVPRTTGDAQKELSFEPGNGDIDVGF
jgi:hypothetical protein